jgi:hypothetical protein
MTMYRDTRGRYWALPSYIGNRISIIITALSQKEQGLRE